MNDKRRNTRKSPRARKELKKDGKIKRERTKATRKMMQAKGAKINQSILRKN